MKRINAIFIAAMSALTLLFSACKPEVDITSDYRETIVVYGLLNPLDEYQYIKIYKGFLTKDNALVYAQNLDNISYYDKIRVVLEEYDANDHFSYGYDLDTTMSIPKNQGDFAAPTQVLYRSKSGIIQGGRYALKEGRRYRLIVISKENQDTLAVAETRTIKNMCFNIPLGTSQSISSFNICMEDPWYVGFKVESQPESVAAIDAYLTFRYIEKNKITGEVSHKSVNDVCLTTGFVASNQTMFKPNTIFRILSQNIKPDENVVRYVDNYQGIEYACIDIKLWACDEVYYRYYKLAQPSSSIVQDRVEYTNIQAAPDKIALGFFASRTYYDRHFKIDVNSHNEDSLISGQWTKDLGFRPYTEYLEGK